MVFIDMNALTRLRSELAKAQKYALVADAKCLRPFKAAFSAIAVSCVKAINRSTYVLLTILDGCKQRAFEKHRVDWREVDAGHDRFRFPVDAQALSDNALAGLDLLGFYIAGLLTISFLVL